MKIPNYTKENENLQITSTHYRPGGHTCPLSPKFQFYFKKGSSKEIPI